jgi:outer membrane protein assembly factor BamB/DNA-binding MarR family transcriptional regulator
MIRKAFSVGIAGLFVIGGLIGLFALVSEEVEAPGPTYVSGLILTNTTWTLADSPYIIIGNVSVGQNVNLTIESGVNVKFDIYKYLRIDGTLYAVGTEMQKITFTSNNTSPSPGDWGGIRFETTSIDSYLEYCTIKYGGGKYIDSKMKGGGIYNIASGLELKNCRIRFNTADDAGGVYNDGTLTIIECLLSRNIANGVIPQLGGGILNSGTVYINNSTISHNEAEFGGGVYNTGSAIMDSCILSNNTAYVGGGGIGTDGGDFTIYSSIMENNDALQGGAIWNIAGSMVVINTTIQNNYATEQDGGGIENAYGILSISNSIIKGNTALQDGGGLEIGQSSNVDIIYTDISENSADIGGGIHIRQGASVSINYTSLIGNTVTNYGAGICGNPTEIYNSNLNNTNHNIWVTEAPDVYAPNNWWGTSDIGLINLSIHDYYDDFSLGEVIFLPFLMEPNPNAPEPQPEEGSGLQENSPWPMFRGNVRHTGLSPYDTSGNPGELKWSFETIENDYIDRSSPAIDSNGTIYIGSTDSSASRGYLYAINHDGTEKWNFTTGIDFHIERSSPAIGSDGTIYIGSDDHKMYAINPDGTEKWNFTTGERIWSSPVVGSDGTIYIDSDDNNLYAINSDGTEKWIFNTGGFIWSSPAITLDGTIYIGSFDNKLYAINPNGTEKWNYLAGGSVWSSPAIDSDGTIYVGATDDTLYAINPNGTEKWSHWTGNNVRSPAIGSDGTIYFSSETEKIHAVYPNGTEKWRFNIGNAGDSIPTIGSDGTIYVGGDDSKIYAINPDGTEKWNYPAGGSVESSPAIDSDGTIYVGSTDGKLYAIGDAPNQPPNTPSTPSGPTSGLTNTSYSFSTSTTDPDGDQIKYGWDWDGDYIVDEWSSLLDSGTEDNRSHSWSVPGVYGVKVKAQDEHGAESGWSNILNITINSPPSNQPPNTPSTPSGPSSGINKTLYSFITSTTDPEGDQIKYGWDWDGDDIVDEWSDLVDSGTEDNRSHSWDTPGSYNLKVKARDEYDAESGWSIFFIVTITVDELDSDGDSIPDFEDEDDDNDGYLDTEDDFPLDPNEWLDTDEDGIGNNADSDDDNDGYLDENDVFPLDPDEWLDTDGDGTGDNADLDDDNDGFNDDEDDYPLDPTRWKFETDIMISSITLSDYGPSPGEQVTIYAAILNTGDDSRDVIVKIFDGDPDDGGTQIGTSQTVTVPSDGTTIIDADWIAVDGSHTLYVIAEDTTTGEETTAYLEIEVGDNIQPILVLTTGDINVYRFEPGEERTISVEVTCYLQNVENIRLVVLDGQNLTIDHTITPPRKMGDGDTVKFYLRIRAPELPDGQDKLEKDILIQVVGDDGVYSNAEELDIVVAESAVSLFSPIFIAGAVAMGSVATLGAAAAASRRNENWKYLLLITLAVPLFTRIKGKKTLDNFVRGQVFGHIQSKPGTHFNDIRKTLKLGNGNLAYHLRKLEKEGFVHSTRDKRYRRFYPIGVDVPEETGITLSKTQDSILDFVEQHPKASQKTIAENLKESQQTVSYNLNVLVREGFLIEEKFKGIKKYTILEENT